MRRARDEVRAGPRSLVDTGRERRRGSKKQTVIAAARGGAVSAKKGSQMERWRLSASGATIQDSEDKASAQQRRTIRGRADGRKSEKRDGCGVAGGRGMGRGLQRRPRPLVAPQSGRAACVHRGPSEEKRLPFSWREEVVYNDAAGRRRARVSGTFVSMYLLAQAPRRCSRRSGSDASFWGRRRLHHSSTRIPATALLACSTRDTSPGSPAAACPRRCPPAW